MSIEKFNPRTIILAIFILVISAARTYLSSDPDMFGLGNFSPLGAMALFGGVYFNQHWKAFVFPLLSLFISDIILQYTVFYKAGNGILYAEWYFVYGAFLLMVFVGRFIRKVNLVTISVAALCAVLIHWLITDIPVWYKSEVYPQTVTGYWQCLVAATPFEWRFLTGTLVYAGVLFGSFEWLQMRYQILAKNN